MICHFIAFSLFEDYRNCEAMQSISEWQNLLLAPSYELPTPMRCIAPMEVVYGWQQDNFISRLSNLKISCPPPAEAVHAAAIPFTEILRGFSSWNPDTSGDARNEKSVMHVPCIRYGLAHDICGTVAVGIETKFWLFCEPMSQSCFQRLFSPRTSVPA